jgi:hypothetical protein
MIQNAQQNVTLSVQENGKLQQEEIQKGKYDVMLLVKDEAKELKETLNIIDEKLDRNNNQQIKIYEGKLLNQANQIYLHTSGEVCNVMKEIRNEVRTTNDKVDHKIDVMGNEIKTKSEEIGDVLDYMGTIINAVKEVKVEQHDIKRSVILQSDKIRIDISEGECRIQKQLKGSQEEVIVEGRKQEQNINEM